MKFRVMTKKYEFTGETKQFYGVTLKRIRRISDGLIGGWIESEHNLSQEGICFIYDSARVYDSAIVRDSARVYDSAIVRGSARVSGLATISGSAIVYDSAEVSGSAIVYDSARVSGLAIVNGSAEVYGSARVSGLATISGSAEVSREALNIYNSKLYTYNITFTDYHIQIGCIQMLYSEWLEVGIEDAEKMGLKRKYYKNVKELLTTLIPHYYGS